MNTATRRDRLLSLLHRGPTTVPALADELGVSERTIFRDIAVLRDAGQDIQATPGHGGGVRMAPDRRLRPVHFEVDEVIGLALFVAILEATPHIPFAAGARRALDRARRALSSDRQRAIQRLQRRVLVGVPATEQVRRSQRRIDDDVLTVFEHCFTHARSMTFAYVDGSGTRSSRRVECVGLVHHHPVWYNLAWDLDKDSARRFRMDRVSQAGSGERLVGVHPLAEVVAISDPDGRSRDDPWRRRPIG